MFIRLLDQAWTKMQNLKLTLEICILLTETNKLYWKYLEKKKKKSNVLVSVRIILLVCCVSITMKDFTSGFRPNDSS